MYARFAALCAICTIPAILVVCSGFTSSDECEPGEASVCETQCGTGTMRCQPDGTWSICTPDDEPECAPGDYGECSFTDELPPGLWFCSDGCRIGPCMQLCIPGETFPCDAQCGPGQQRCLNEGDWSECREFVLPPCRPGEVARCDEESDGHRRCDETCGWGPCDGGAPCNAGEVADCGHCASQVCQADETWSTCQADPWATCSPGDTETCEAPCGPGQRTCNDSCEWTDCMEFDAVECHPGDRQVCPTTLYCGIAFRVCNSICEWSQCIETGD